MELPSHLSAALIPILGAAPHQVQPIGNSGFNAAARLTAKGKHYLVKWSDRPPQPPPDWPDPLTAEARGLALLAAAEVVRVPQVYALGPTQAEGPSFLLLEWITAEPSVDRQTAGTALGDRLAEQHRVTAQAYGLDHHNYCGATPQANGWRSSWIDFYGQQRLAFQMELAAQNGRLPSARRRRLEHLIERLDAWIDEQAVQPALLHGDLWGGNWLIAAQNEPVLIDPAVYFGDREAELAMCRLFGGFPDSFYRAYDEAWPPAPGRDERVPLYQLYHLLNHLSLFGESYGGQVDRILRHYIG